MIILYQFFLLQNNFYELTTQEHKYKGDFELKPRFKTFIIQMSGIKKINLTLIWYDKFN